MGAPSPIDLRRPLTIAGRPAELHVVGELSASLGFADDDAEPFSLAIEPELFLPDGMLRDLDREVMAVAFARLTARPAFREIIDNMEARP